MTPQPEIVVKGFWVTQFSHKNYKGSGYCEDQKLEQRLIRRTPHKFLWWTFWSEEVLDTEIVPSYVWIGLGALGFDSSGWKSKFKEFIK